MFPSPLCEGLASVIIEHVVTTKANQVQCVEAADEGDATANVFPIGTRVEVFWTGENKWYSGLVTDSVVKKGDVYGKRKYRREIEVHYDDDNLKVRHSLHNNTVRIEPHIDRGPSVNALYFLEGQDTGISKEELAANLHNGDYEGTTFVTESVQNRHRNRRGHQYQRRVHHDWR